MTINNYDSRDTFGPKYYSGQTTTHKSELVIDLVKPFHCSITSTCTDNILDRGPPTTKSVSSSCHLKYNIIMCNIFKLLNTFYNELLLF